MTLLVSYMPESRIETDAEALLDEFAKATGAALTAPVPIDDIVEKHLKLGIEFDDLHRRFGAPNSVLAQGPDIIGAIFLSQRRIVVDEFLDPDADPSKEGRYRFTVAHEVGHWRLHRGLMGKDIGNVPVEDSPQALVICRSSEAKVRVELQADIFASCLLMPRRLVQAAWNAVFTPGVRAVVPLLAGVLRMEPLRFYAANIGSAFLWAPLHILPGAMAGYILHRMGAEEERLAIAAAAAIVLMWFAWLAWQERKK